MPSHEAAGIVLLEPVLLPLWVYLAWHGASNYTSPRWWTMAGAGLILIGLLLRYATDAFRRPIITTNDEPRISTEQQ